MAWIKSKKKKGNNETVIEYLAKNTIANYYINENTGAQTSYSGWSASDFIEVNGGETIHFAWGYLAGGYQNKYNACYNSSKQFISSKQMINGGYATWTVPANAKYIRISSLTSTLNDTQVWRENSIITDGNANIVFDDYLYLNNESIDTPITLNSNHRIFIDFQLDSFLSQLQIAGNTAGNTQNFYCGLYITNGDRFYVRTSDGEHYQILSDYTARHTLDVNNNGKVLVDNVEWYSGTSNTNANARYTIGYRNTDYRMIGKVFRFFLYDTVNEEYVIDLMPAHFTTDYGTFYGMYDVVNKKFYPKQSR